MKSTFRVGRLKKLLRRAAYRFAFVSTYSMAVAAVVLPANLAQADVLAGWNVSGQTGYGTQGFAPTTSAADITIVGLTRGSGVATTGTAAGRAWGGAAWTAASEAAAISANQYFTFSLTANSGHTLSLTNVTPFDYRRSSTGPASGELQYQIGAGSFVDISALSYSSSSSSGASLSSIDLSSISALQNVSPNTTVTFRVVNWGGGSAGTWYVFDKANSSASDMAINGSVGIAVSSTSGTWDPIGANANWNISDQNWLKNSAQATYAEGDTATFDDTGVVLHSGSVVVDAGGVKPGAVFVTNNSGTYTFSGGSIGDPTSGPAGVLTKNNNGTLVLTANNSYSGGTVINGGTIEVTADSQLGSTAGAISLGGGTLKSDLAANGSNLQLDPARTVTGTGGSIDVAANTTLTVQGNTTIAGILTLPNNGTAALTGGTRSLAGLKFTSADPVNLGTLKIGAITTDTVTMGGDVSITASSGTATVDGSLDFGTTAHTITVPGTSKLVITGGLIDTKAVTISGTGTVDAQGNNSGLNGQSVDLGATVAIGTAGATFIVHDGNSLGSGTMFFNSGTIHAATPTLPATSITFPSTLIQSVGASGPVSAAATYEGADMEFQGSVHLHRPATGPNQFTVNNNTTFSGGWSADNGVLTNLSGIVINGSGSLTLSNTAGGDFSQLVVPVTVDTATVNVNAPAGGATSITAQNSGKINLNVDNALANTANVVLTNGGKLSTGGKTQSLGTLTVTGTNTLDLGAAASPTNVNFADSSGTPWGTQLNITGWTAGTDHIYFGAPTTNNGLSATQLGEIKFSDFAQGASLTVTDAGGELTPQVGDINQDGTVNAKDVSALMAALSDMSGYQAGNALFAGTASTIRQVTTPWDLNELNVVADIDRSGSVNSLDIQAEIALIANETSPGGGGGSITAVPEPSAIVLGVLGSVLCLVGCGKRRRRAAAKSARPVNQIS